MHLVKLIKILLSYTYIKAIQVCICVMHFLFRIIWNKEMLYCHSFTTFL